MKAAKAANFSWVQSVSPLIVTLGSWHILTHSCGNKQTSDIECAFASKDEIPSHIATWEIQPQAADSYRLPWVCRVCPTIYNPGILDANEQANGEEEQKQRFSYCKFYLIQLANDKWQQQRSFRQMISRIALSTQCQGPGSHHNPVGIPQHSELC